MQEIIGEKSMETIISACISAGVTLIVCLISNHGQQERTRALMEYKLDELTKRVDKHNNTIVVFIVNLLNIFNTFVSFSSEA